MKKILFSLAVCACALTACTSEEVIEEGVQGNAIGFQNAVSKESRAITNATLNKFFVYGYYTKTGFEGNPVNVFDGETVTLSNGTWGYANTRYWVPDMKYYFYAYSCDNQELNPAYGNAALNLEGGDVKHRALRINEYVANNTHQHDLIFATNDTGIDGKETGNAKVGFNFQHILTNVNVVFSSEFAAGYDIKVSDVKIENIYDQGTYNPYGETVWSGVARKTASPFINLSVPTDAVASAAIPASGDQGAVAAKTITTGSGYVIPHHYTTTSVRLTFKVSISNNGNEVLARNLTGTWMPNWVSGNRYTYNVKIAGTNTDLEPIVFETSENMNLDGWTDGSTTEVNFTFSAN